MPETTPNGKGPAPIKLPTEATEPALILADQLKPEDIGTLTIEYRDGQPVIVLSGGKYIPAGLTLVDGSGAAAANYVVATKARQLAQKGGGELLEPITAVEVVTPEDYAPASKASAEPEARAST
ncbi:hypothetical protein ACFRQM_40330 [Streptomyces sp. NPDC056831]|uniref:hypothetical protein n=1 Tax=Streptomyces sp. NPDC056831 TaxID=3345954 RepID=UPI00368EA7F5